MIKKLFKIGEIMRYLNLSRQVIHNYTQLELISVADRTPSGHRLYGEEVFERLEEIKRLQSEGKTLMQIKKLLNEEDHCNV